MSDLKNISTMRLLKELIGRNSLQPGSTRTTYKGKLFEGVISIDEDHIAYLRIDEEALAALETKKPEQVKRLLAVDVEYY